MGLQVNYVGFSGNLTADPEVRYTQTGIACCEVTIAHNKGKERNPEQTIFLPVVIFGKTAETCGRVLSKGDSVLVEGELFESRWQTKDGQKRSQIKLMANNVHFIYVKSGNNGNNGNNYGVPQ